MLAALSRRYTAPAGDLLAQEVARRQRARLGRALAARIPLSGVSRWVHVPLAALFAQAGNRLYPRSNGSQETGHEPAHGSKSGRCILLDPQTGRWWCRGCRQHGDAAAFVMTWRGCTYPQAVRWLTARYGAPASRGGLLRPPVEA
jgi:hypothetical protein